MVQVTTTEEVAFQHRIPPGHVGVMDHFWSTCSPAAEAALLRLALGNAPYLVFQDFHVRDVLLDWIERLEGLRGAEHTDC